MSRVNLAGPKPGRPTKQQVQERESKNVPAKVGRPTDFDIQEVHRGVSITWLMQAFRMDRQVVKRKLAHLQPIRMERGGIPVYDLVQAAQYLVKPRTDMKEFIKTMRPADLPLDVQKDYWDARAKKQRFEEKASQLWRTEDVVTVLGDMFKMIKNTMNLWVDSIEDQSDLTGAQKKLLVQLVDGLQNEIYQELIALHNKQKTPNSKVRYEEEKEDEDDEV